VCMLIGALGPSRESRTSRADALREQWLTADFRLTQHRCPSARIAMSDRDWQIASARELGELLCARETACVGPWDWGSRKVFLIHGSSGSVPVLDRFLRGPLNCGWQRVEAWPHATLLARPGAGPTTGDGVPPRDAGGTR
jgi:hypothetical protein